MELLAELRSTNFIEGLFHWLQLCCAEDSTAYAAAVVKTILNTARNLSSFPFSGRVVTELGDESIREWWVE